MLAMPPLNARVIPTLLLDGDGRLVKTVRFKKRTYIGDPINAVRIFNEKEVDEIILLDIDACRQQRSPDFDLVEAIAAEAFMPLAYGGGIKTLDDIAKLFQCGIEKVILSSCLIEGYDIVSKAAGRFGSQAIIACLPTKKGLLGGPTVRFANGRQNTTRHPTELAKTLENAGVGEIILYSIDRDGAYTGYDCDLLKSVTRAVSVPVVACGGAGSLADMRRAIDDAQASAVAAGSLFVYQAKERGVLITYPSRRDMENELLARRHA